MAAHEPSQAEMELLVTLASAPRLTVVRVKHIATGEMHPLICLIDGDPMNPTAICPVARMLADHDLSQYEPPPDWKIDFPGGLN